jgi:uncharacterized protein YdaL
MDKDVIFLQTGLQKGFFEQENTSWVCIPGNEMATINALSYNNMIIRNLWNKILFC